MVDVERVPVGCQFVPTLHILIYLQEGIDLGISRDSLTLELEGLIYLTLANQGPHINLDGASDLFATN